MRTVVVALTAVSTLVLAGCGSTTSDEAVETAPTTEQTEMASEMPEATPTTEQTEMASEMPEATPQPTMTEMGSMDPSEMGSMDPSEMGSMDPSEMGSMDPSEMGSMNMGDPDATPAQEVAGADLVSGQFTLLDTAPEGYDDVSGTADLARHDGGTTVTIELSGLQPDTEFISHVHQGSCDEGGGEHYKFDPDGSDMPPNEIHLDFTSDADGNGVMTAENDQTATEQAQSVVVHPEELQDNRVACAQLEE